MKNILNNSLFRRVVKTMAQTALGIIGSSLVLSDVNWAVVGSSVVLSGITCILMNLSMIEDN